MKMNQFKISDLIEQSEIDESENSETRSVLYHIPIDDCESKTVLLSSTAPQVFDRLLQLRYIAQLRLVEKLVEIIPNLGDNKELVNKNGKNARVFNVKSNDVKVDISIHITK